VRILVVDAGSNALDWALRCQDHGHEVIWYAKRNEDRTVMQAGKGLVNRLVDYDLLRSRYMDWADLIFTTDNSRYTDMLEPYRQRGYPIFGPSPEASELELDRAMGQKAMKRAGLKTIPGVEFHDYDAAAAFVRENPTYLVSKPSGDADKALSYVADDAASLIYMLLGRWKKNDKYRRDANKYGFILQEKKHGVEMAVGGWFGPSGWSQWFYENFEEKKLMNDGLGPNTGEMGTLSMYVKRSKLAETALRPMTKLLHELDYIGFCDVSGMIDAKGEFWPFEFTMRPGWPTFYNQIATHDGDPAQWMVDLMNGEDTLQAKAGAACISVVMAIPDFPYSKLTKKELSGIPVYNATDREHVHLCEIMLEDDVPMQLGDKIVNMPGYVTCGDYVCVVTGTGDTISGARKSAYAAVRKIKMPADPFYRTDIGVRVTRVLPDIQKHGFAADFRI
jgi:phosphoribosylamine--glycine ligase